MVSVPDFFRDFPNCITGSKVRAILLNGLVLPIGGISAVKGLESTGLSRIVFFLMIHNLHI